MRKGVYSIRKEFASEGSKFFPFRVDPFSTDQFGSKLFPFRMGLGPIRPFWSRKFFQKGSVVHES